MILQDEVVDLPTPTSPMRTYLYHPAETKSPGASPRYPGLLLYSEIFQQTGPIRRSALHFASQGYLVAVPEIFHDREPAGSVLNYDAEGTDRGNRYKFETPLSTFDNDARVALSYLAAHPLCTGRLGTVGFCIGGHLAFRAAFNEKVEAACCFYATDIHSSTLGAGQTCDSLQRVPEIGGELMMVWGRQDPHVPDEGRLLIYRRLLETGVNYTWHEVNAAHAFMRDEGPRYNPSLARIGYGLAFDLFERTLKV
ncbi:MAG: dienelactone hydrolase family protein [Chloroflexi bacterium]|nr:dienelactone hydrolase family protein [Chloroflexota bacterium]